MRTRQACALALVFVLLTGGLTSAEDIELVDGTVITGSVQRVDEDRIVVSTAGKLMLFIPRKFLSLYQNYQFKCWRLKADDLDPAVPQNQFDYGQWCLENSAYDERLLSKAKKHLDKARSLDGALADKIKALILKYGFNPNPKDPTKPWVSEDELHKLKGDKWDAETQAWYPPPKYKKLMEERERNVKIRYLGSTKPNLFHFATTSLIRGNLTDYHGKKVHIWGRVLAVQFKDFPNDLVSGKHKFTAGPYARVLLATDDCPAVYFDLKVAGLKQKLEKFKAGDRVVVYGTVRVGQGRFALDAVDMVVK